MVLQMASKPSDKGKRKLVESSSASQVKTKKNRVTKSAPAKAPDDSVAQHFKRQDQIEDDSGSGSPKPRKKKKTKESPLKVLRNGKAIATRSGRGGGRGRERGSRVKEALAEVLAMTE